jgi:ribonuclease J
MASEKTIRIIPLGGLGQIGMNCMVVEYGEEAVLIDCGMTFPSSADFGVEVILPAWGYVLENVERFSAILLTHGHEDHIGALPYLLREVDIPIYGTPLTLGLLRHKLREHELLDDCELIEVKAGDRFALDTMEVEYVHVNHSMPQAAAVVLHTELGAVVHTGDWRIDESPIRGEPIDMARFTALGDEGVVCLLGDSTNVEEPGSPRSESEAAAGLESVIAAARERVLVTQFSSNVYRLQALLDIAQRLERTVFVLGRSLERMVETASDLGLLVAPEGEIHLGLKRIDDMDPSEVLVVCTGSQGEPRAALSRIARDDHKWLKVRAGDTVLFSARVVPGNEMPVARVQNALWERGAEVVTPHDAPIHTTGHAYYDDMKRMIEAVRPRNLVPVHGESRMLIKHARLAGSLGHTAHLLRNGETLVLTGKSIDDVVASRGESVECGRVIVDGTGVGDVTEQVLRDRRRVAKSGFFVVYIALDKETGKIISGPDILQYGAIDEEVSGVLDEVRHFVVEELSRLVEVPGPVAPQVAETARIAVRRWFRRNRDRKPVVLPLVREF